MQTLVGKVTLADEVDPADDEASRVEDLLLDQTAVLGIGEVTVTEIEKDSVLVTGELTEISLVGLSKLFGDEEIDEAYDEEPLDERPPDGLLGTTSDVSAVDMLVIGETMELDESVGLLEMTDDVGETPEDT
jgi:hypothetical protein